MGSDADAYFLSMHPKGFLKAVFLNFYVRACEFFSLGLFLVVFPWPTSAVFKKQGTEVFSDLPHIRVALDYLVE